MSDDVIGREAELETLSSFLDAVRAGPRTLVLEGEAGAGKTTLWLAGLAAAREKGYVVLSTRPVQAETKLSLAAVGDLLEGVVDDVLAQLPEPQRRALAGALLLEDAGGAPHGERAVAVAFLGALRSLAKGGPLVVAVDDVQWLDAPSADVLAFAARRLREERIGILFAERAGVPVPFELDDALPGLVHVPVGALSLGALHRLVHTRLGVTFARPTLRRLHAGSGGNPFFALELARALKTAGDSIAAGDALPVPRSLRELLRKRLAALPSETESVLLAAAALSAPTLTLLEEATGHDVREAIRAGIEAEIIEVDGNEVRFAHPLLASEVYARATPRERRAVHARLASVVVDVEERARHLALAAEGRDAAVARALDEAARRARDRGAPGAAAELSERALRLTPPDDTADARRRTLEAAWYHFAAGNTERPRMLLEDAIRSWPEGSDRVRALARLARLSVYDEDRRDAVRLFERALAEAGDDVAIRAEAEEGTAWCFVLMRENIPRAAEHARTAVALAERLGDDVQLADALSVLAQAELLLGEATASGVIARALALDTRGELRVLRRPEVHSAFLLFAADELDAARTRLEQVYDEAVDRGDESALAWVLFRLGHLECVAGNWTAALEHAESAVDLAVQTGQQTTRAGALAVVALAEALRGHVDSSRTAAEEALALADRFASGMARTIAVWALGFLELSLGDAAAAHERLAALVDANRRAGIVEPGENRFLPDDVEALIGLGSLAEAQALLAEFERFASALDRPAALAAAARCRGMLAAAEGDALRALTWFENALARHDRVAMPFERARTLLALGSAERRAKRKRAARTSMQEALAIFEEVDARLWAERARSELARIGGRAPSAGELTPTEERVAALVAEGRTNREVASALFVSDRTVESHLSSIYSKLGVRSRAELARRFSTETAAAH